MKHRSKPGYSPMIKCMKSFGKFPGRVFVHVSPREMFAAKRPASCLLGKLIIIFYYVQMKELTSSV